ncbi:MAG: alpha-1,2-fucosyltransferase [Runella sp.]
MIIVKLRGGLGNQLFQYALGRRLSLEYQTNLLLDTSALGRFSWWTYRVYSLDAFSMKAEMISKAILQKSKWAYFKESHFHFDPQVLTLRPPIYLDGYWQSERYFEPISNLLRQDLTLRKPLSDMGLQMEHHIKTQSQSVAIHLRRGDYTRFSLANRFLKPCPLEYYEKAVCFLATQMTSEATFFVFSDDIPWAKKYFKWLKQVYFVEGLTAIEDLWLLSLCNHQIISNSTFGWWGAWLNPNPYKTVIAPQKWFSRGDHNTNDLIPSAWIKC